MQKAQSSFIDSCNDGRLIRKFSIIFSFKRMVTVGHEGVGSAYEFGPSSALW